MRPFKFFFLVSVGIILFLAVAKVIFIAMFIAAIMSIIFYGIKTIANLFRNIDRANSNAAYASPRMGHNPFEFERQYHKDDMFKNQSSPWKQEEIIKIY